jgi:hypothetical protein
MAEIAKTISAKEFLLPARQGFLSDVEEKWTECLGNRHTCPFVNFPWHDIEHTYSSNRYPPMDLNCEGNRWDFFKRIHAVRGVGP